MMDNIGDILAGRRIEEPAEVQIIKRFVREKYHASSEITVQQSQIIIAVKGAALAGALRPHLITLQRLCNTEKRLILRIR